MRDLIYKYLWLFHARKVFHSNVWTESNGQCVSFTRQIGETFFWFDYLTFPVWSLKKSQGCYESSVFSRRSKKFFSTSDATFHTCFIQEIQKYAPNWNLTGHFWGQSKILQKSAAQRAILAVLVSWQLKNGSLDVNLIHTFEFLGSSWYLNKH